MKKSMIFIILILILAVSLIGCSSTESNEMEIEKIETEATPVKTDSTETETGLNADKERISGEISKIVGNSITLELYEVPERGANRTESTENATSPLTSQAPVQGSGGKNGGGGGKDVSTLEKTGETIEVVIPVGSVIKSLANPDMTFEIEALTKGMNITVFVNSELTESAKETNPDSKTIYAGTVNIIE
ncbi:hypothetical protein QUF55_07580 [Clostridiaceae bacterium HSG29]|nr:hypothetical protein [Clostridiaceae bacterium HSG29]